MAFRFLDAAGACAACLVLMGLLGPIDLRAACVLLPRGMPVSGMFAKLFGSRVLGQVLVATADRALK